jgi:hypothetical protein
MLAIKIIFSLPISLFSVKNVKCQILLKLEPNKSLATVQVKAVAKAVAKIAAKLWLKLELMLWLKLHPKLLLKLRLKVGAKART